MKILTFTTLFPNQQMPQHGLFIKARVAALAQKHEIRVVAPVPYFPKWNVNKKWFQFSQVPLQETIDGITVYHPRYFLTPKIGRSLYSFFMFVSLYPFVRRLQKEFNFDLIDAHFIYPDGVAAGLIAKALKKRVVMTARGTDINWYPQFRLIRPLIRRALMEADAVIAVSENLKDEIKKMGLGDDDVTVIPNGVDTQKFYPRPRSDARRQLNLPQNRKVILSIGHLVEAKGFHLLIEALSKMDNTDADLVIIGSGPYEKKLQQLTEAHGLSPRVRFLPEKPQKELPLWYAAADTFALTSLREGRPNVVLEALACGIPVLSMNNWGLTEFVGANAGILLNDHAPDKIALALNDILHHPWDPKKIGSSVRDCAWENTAAKIENLWATVAQKEDILFFSSDDWASGLKTSKYHLSTRLARANRVFFINSLSLRAPTLSKRDLSKIFAKLKGYFKGVRRVRRNIFVYTPLLIPFQRFPAVRRLNQIFLTLQFKGLMAKHKIRKPIIWTFLPNTLDLIRQLPRKGLVYYCVDDMSAFQGVPDDLIRRQDEELTKEADVTFSVSKELFEKKYSLNKNSFYSPHGVDFELFNQACTDSTITKPADIEGIRQPIIGFYGLISADWIDYKLVQFLAQQRPEWSFVFIGKIDRKPGDGFAENTNIHYLPVKPYEELYRYSRFFDVAILPFNINALTLHSHPLKILEYLSAGRPVVSVDIPEARNYIDVIEVASDYPDFLKKIEHSLTADTPARQKARVEFASKNSWEKRFHAVQDIIRLHI